MYNSRLDGKDPATLSRPVITGVLRGRLGYKGVVVTDDMPYLSLLREKEGKRFGVCSFCGFEYRVRRIACVYCDEADQKKLKLFRVAEYPGVRVDVCETCCGW